MKKAEVKKGKKTRNEKLDGGDHACCEQYQHCRHAKAVADQHRGACHQLGHGIHRISDTGNHSGGPPECHLPQGIERRCDQIPDHLHSHKHAERRF